MPTMEERSFPANTFIPHLVILYCIFKTENGWLLCSFVVESDCGVKNAPSDVEIYYNYTYRGFVLRMAKSNFCCRIFVIVGVKLWCAFRGPRLLPKWPVKPQKQKLKNKSSNYNKNKA